MRPYMLWLARQWAGSERSVFSSREPNRTELEDWVSYTRELRFLVEAGRR